MSAILYGCLLLMFSALSLGFLMDRAGYVTEITDSDGNIEHRSIYGSVLKCAILIYIPYTIVGVLLNWE